MAGIVQLHNGAQLVFAPPNECKDDPAREEYDNAQIYQVMDDSSKSPIFVSFHLDNSEDG